MDARGLVERGLVAASRLCSGRNRLARVLHSPSSHHSRAPRSWAGTARFNGMHVTRSVPHIAPRCTYGLDIHSSSVPLVLVQSRRARHANKLWLSFLPARARRDPAAAGGSETTPVAPPAIVNHPLSHPFSPPAPQSRSIFSSAAHCIATVCARSPARPSMRRCSRNQSRVAPV